VIEYLGKTILTTLEELANPTHTALIIVDVQNDAVTRDGKTVYPELLRNVKELLDGARRFGVLVIFIKDTLLRNRISDSPSYLRRYMISRKLDHPGQIRFAVVDGTWGQEFPELIAPLRDEIVFRKYRSSAFHGTALDTILRNNNIKSIVVVGLATEGCVSSTCRDGGDEYYVVVVKDAVVTASSQEIHEAALKVLASRYDMATTKEIVEIWRNAHVTNSERASVTRVKEETPRAL
jgi:nicotinamidase-related amidase